MKMSKEEVIKGLTSLLEVRRKYIDMQTMKEEMQCLEMAIEALEQKPCEYAISRQAVLDLQAKYVEHMGATKFWQMRDDIKTLPPVNPQEPETGHWIVSEGGSIYCSECGCGALYDKVFTDASISGKAIRVKSDFCPTCGVRMQERRVR